MRQHQRQERYHRFFAFYYFPLTVSAALRHGKTHCLLLWLLAIASTSCLPLLGWKTSKQTSNKSLHYKSSNPNTHCILLASANQFTT
ncbi:hypothetical protein DER46DRAFT_607474 [Fusarium sp. MPI-SDFR-AT-0072]|nr:hypothetical protein DER46DRAFT_607474 [Fusarium sp. MPI-SDFR-AT-0072]